MAKKELTPEQSAAQMIWKSMTRKQRAEATAEVVHKLFTEMVDSKTASIADQITRIDNQKDN